MTLKLTKIAAGWYATADGHWATIVDCTGEGEWSAVHDPAGLLRTDKDSGETFDWYATKREAIAECQRRFDARARFAEAINRSSPALWR